MIKISERVLGMPLSAIRKLTPLAIEAKKKGVKVYHLNIGDPDIKTPRVMLNAIRNFSPETIRYAQSTGEPELIYALKVYYHRLGFKSIKDQDIIATIGGSEALVMALFAVTEPDDEVLVFEPFYSNYASAASFVNIKLIPVPTSIKYGFHLPARKLIESRITKRTKAILFCSPNNPTGTIYSREEMQLLVSIAKANNLFLLSDEVYREFAFNDQKHTSILEFLSVIPNQIILLDSLSKRYNLCGARIGVLLSKNTEVIQGATKIAQSRLSGGLIDQVVASKLNKVPVSYTKKVIKEYQKRRDTIFDGLSKIPGVFLTKPEGAFYAMVKLPVKNAEDFAIFLLKDFRLNNATVMLAPGTGFYSEPQRGMDRIRIAYVLKTKDLKKCIEIISQGLKAYANLHLI